MARTGNARLHRTRHSYVLRVGAAVAVIAVFWLVFELGRIQAGYNLVDAAAERRAYQDAIDDLEGQVTTLKERIALLETHREIDRSAYEKVESTLEGLQRKIQEQREAIAFYRGIISPADGSSGLRVQDLKVTKGKGEREYRVSLVLVQVMQHDNQVRGDVAFSLEGAQDGETVTYTLEQLVAGDEDSSWPFSFRYFQTFERDLVLPDGFTPEKVNIEVRSRTKSVASIEQSFAWQGASQG
ncbi:MAG TPA: DUF6776 family protein [Woeseiaceae bacterium]|nr:DUF6776 family protein [Woeseiaceae bacterium]